MPRLIRRNNRFKKKQVQYILLFCRDDDDCLVWVHVKGMGFEAATICIMSGLFARLTSTLRVVIKLWSCCLFIPVLIVVLCLSESLSLSCLFSQVSILFRSLSVCLSVSLSVSLVCLVKHRSPPPLSLSRCLFSQVSIFCPLPPSDPHTPSLLFFSV